MAEQATDTSTGVTTTETTVDTGVQTGESAEGKGFNIADLPKEAWAEIYKSDRFKQLNDKAKQAEILIKDKATAEENSLKEQGKWKELAEAAETRIKSVEKSTIAAELKAFAAKLGAFDINDIAALADKAGVEIKDGVVTGAEEAVKALFDAKPHLFNNQTKTTVGSGTNPGNSSNQGNPKFTLSQINNMTGAEYAENKDAIMRAITSGNVVNDRT
ncbi:hypothetical protein [Cryobacterium sp. GrIS_2_6]|uniref:phage scaffolding protein n=1 Tax=Cryobacterium sp. GrIS_2_6 TaxID=3162785 RepID=UPI002DFCC5E5|nr:hypothetical protein [Cryobacterium psychrotolerans]